MIKNVGIAGVGAIGSAVARALVSERGINGFKLGLVSDPYSNNTFDVENVDFDALVEGSDIIIECLPADIVPALAEKVFAAGKDIVFISSAALLIYPQIMEAHKKSRGNAYLPSGALCGLDGVKAMKEMGIESAQITSTKKPSGFSDAPYIEKNNINLSEIKQKTILFEGNALEASHGFPANINVAATLSLAGIGANDTRVEIWADPEATGNTHEITVKSQYSTMTSRIENMPDPNNPKSSVLAAQSIVSTLRDMSSALKIS